MGILMELVRKLVLIAIFSAFCELLLPRSSFRAYLRLVVGLLVIALVLQPVLELRGAALDLEGMLGANLAFSQESPDTSWVREQTQGMVEQELAGQICAYLQSDYPGYEVEVSLDVTYDQYGCFSEYKGMEVLVRPGSQGIQSVQPVSIGGTKQDMTKCSGQPELVQALARQLGLPAATITVWVYTDGGGTDGR